MGPIFLVLDELEKSLGVGELLTMLFSTAMNFQKADWYLKSHQNLPKNKLIQYINAEIVEAAQNPNVCRTSRLYTMSLKQKGHQGDNIFITGCTKGCHFDNLWLWYEWEMVIFHYLSNNVYWWFLNRKIQLTMINLVIGLCIYVSEIDMCWYIVSYEVHFFALSQSTHRFRQNL